MSGQQRGSMIVTFDDGERLRDGVVQPDSPPVWMVSWNDMPAGEAEMHLDFPDLVVALGWAATKTDKILVQYQGTRFYAREAA